jgi:hypothetical protein
VEKGQKKKKKEKEKNKIKSKIQQIKQTYFLATLPCSPWAMLTTWLHLGVHQKI